MGGTCENSVEAMAIKSAAVYISFVVLCPSIAFSLVWWRRDFFPLSPAPRNWKLLAVALTIGPLLQIPDASFPFVLVLFGATDVSLTNVCHARFYMGMGGGFASLLAFLLMFIQVLSRFEFARLQCDLVFADSSEVDCAVTALPGQLTTEALHERLRTLQPWTRNPHVLRTWLIGAIAYACLLVTIDFAGGTRCSAGFVPGHCNDSCVTCGAAAWIFLTIFFSMEGLFAYLLYRCRRKKLSDEFGILREHQIGLSLFFPATLLHVALIIVLPIEARRAWPLTLWACFYVSVCPCAVHCCWPVLRTFDAGEGTNPIARRLSKPKTAALDPSSTTAVRKVSKAGKSVVHATASKRGDTLESVLASSVGLRALVEFLLREFAVESILFWRACTALRERRHELEKARPSLESSAPKRSERRARLSEPLDAVRDVHRHYVAEGAVHEVNLPYSIRVRVATAISSAETALDQAMPSRFDSETADTTTINELWDAMDAALAEIIQVLTNDTFPRFIHSPQYACFQSMFLTDGSFEQKNALHSSRMV